MEIVAGTGKSTSAAVAASAARAAVASAAITHIDTHTQRSIYIDIHKSIVKCSSYVAVVAFNLLARCWQLHHAKATLTTMMMQAAVAVAATGLALDLASAFLGYFLKLTASA